MAVVTEPPWLNKSVGIAARNGTNSHTITFSTFGDAPFTPTTGSLLTVEVFGAVTHTVSAGDWAEQLSPVNSAELSLFTVTTSGHTDIVITHNGSNYPIGVVIREYPVGSTYVAGAGDANITTDNTWNTLSGLTGGTGNEVVIIGARGRAVISATATAADSVWSAPYVEDADLFALFSGTDGFYLTSGHQINFTGTSVTPAAATSYTGGAGFANDRQHIVYAINATATGDTPNEGSAAVGLDLAVAATGARTSAGSSDTGLNLAVAGSGSRPSAAAATLGLDLAVAATGSSPAGGTAALTLNLAVTAAGARTSQGAAALGLDLAVSASGARAAAGEAAFGLGLSLAASGASTIPEGSAALTLDLALAAAGNNGQAGRPVTPYPFTPEPVTAFPCMPRPVRSFTEVTA